MLKYNFKRSGSMNNLKIKKFDISILDKAKLITKGTSFFKTFDLNNGNIIKVVKTLDECMNMSNRVYLRNNYQEFMDTIYKKIEYSKNIDIDCLNLPNCIYLKDDMFVAYSVPKLYNCSDLDSYLLNNYSMEEISQGVINLVKEVRKLNKNNINLPDLCNLSNVLINSKKELKFIDYDGMQIDKFYSFSMSSLINYSYSPFTENRKYCDQSGFINNNFDKVSLYLIYLYYTTNTSITFSSPYNYVRKNGKYTLREDAILKYLEDIGLNNTAFGENIYRIYNDEKLNYPDTSIKKLINTHTLKYSKFIIK